MKKLSKKGFIPIMLLILAALIIGFYFAKTSGLLGIVPQSDIVFSGIIIEPKVTTDYLGSIGKISINNEGNLRMSALSTTTHGSMAIAKIVDLKKNELFQAGDFKRVTIMGDLSTFLTGIGDMPTATSFSDLSLVTNDLSTDAFEPDGNVYLISRTDASPNTDIDTIKKGVSIIIEKTSPTSFAVSLKDCDSCAPTKIYVLNQPPSLNLKLRSFTQKNKISSIQFDIKTIKVEMQTGTVTGGTSDVVVGPANIPVANPSPGQAQNQATPSSQSFPQQNDIPLLGGIINFIRGLWDKLWTPV